jgi:SAM-dependent methyltransferase
MTTSWNMGKLLGTSSGYWRGCALQAGVRLGIFTRISKGETGVEEIAATLETDQRATEFLLDALVAMGLLVKENERYSNSEAADTHLVKDKPGYLGYIIQHHHHLVDGWAQLDEVVRTGQPVERRSYGDEVERESFLMGMFNLAMATAPEVVAQIDLNGRRRLLDLGGGPGTYAIHFCKANTELTATIFDRPTTEPFARSTVEQFGLSERIEFRGGDFNTDSIPGGPFDVAWLSHILHSNGPQACRDLINKVVTILKPGGMILIHDFILDNDRAAPEFPALFSLNMLLGTAQGQSYSQEEITTMLEEAGVQRIHRLPYQAPNDAAIICGIAR